MVFDNLDNKIKIHSLYFFCNVFNKSEIWKLYLDNVSLAFEWTCLVFLFLPKNNSDSYLDDLNLPPESPTKTPPEGLPKVNFGFCYIKKKKNLKV